VSATPARQDDQASDDQASDDQAPDEGTPPEEGPVPAPAWWRRAVADRRRALSTGGEDGMSTAEYAVGTVAACAFAAVLYRVVTGGSIVSALGDLVESALATLS
jgi:hypothetical protein